MHGDSQDTISLTGLTTTALHIEREASLFNLKFLAARVRVYVRQLADGVGMNATFLLSISSFIKLPTLEKCEHKNSFIHILLYKFVAQFRVQIIP